MATLFKRYIKSIWETSKKEDVLRNHATYMPILVQHHVEMIQSLNNKIYFDYIQLN